MFSISRWLLIPALLIGWLGLSAEAFAAKYPEIKDQAKLFSAEAVEQANQKIKAIYRDYDKDLFVETVPGIPKDLQEKSKELGKNKFFVQWAEKRAKDEGVKGIYVLICKEPAHLQITVNKLAPAKAFSREDGQKLSRLMLEKFSDRKNDKRFDAGLMAGVDFVESTLASNLPRRSAASRDNQASAAASNPASRRNSGAGGGIMGWVCIGVVGLLAFWLVMGLFRAFSGASRSGGGGYGAGGYGGGGGGGGFFSSLLGGMFGAAAGMWMYNHFFGGGGWGSNAYGGDYGSSSADNTGGDVSGGDYGGGDFSGDEGDGGGGDFGGGDFGGGDAGGGDFGGGDFGSGGDFGGGDFGGGDF